MRVWLRVRIIESEASASGPDALQYATNSNKDELDLGDQPKKEERRPATPSLGLRALEGCEIKRSEAVPQNALQAGAATGASHIRRGAARPRLLCQEAIERPPSDSAELGPIPSSLILLGSVGND